jgi:NAD(P)H-hydrate epimerase
MKYLLTGAEMTKADRCTSEVIGIPSLVLMERAALGVAEEIEKRFPKKVRVTVLAGRGNNGADAIAAGRLLTDRGYPVSFFITKGKVGEDSSMAVQLKVIKAYGLSCRVYEPGCGMLEEAEPEVLIDGLFGTGLARNIEGDLEEAVSEINCLRERHGVFVTSVDIPSGISSDDGSVMGCAVKSDLTVTFAFYKRGQFLYPGAAFCGELVLKEIGITERSLDKKPDMFIYDHERIRDLVPDRDPAGNKGTFGKVLVTAGSAGMCGAAFLSASAAFAAGAGMVKIFTPEENRPVLQTLLPEAMVTACDPADPESLREKLRKDLEWADILILGPGIGRGDYANTLLHDLYTIMQEEKALVRGLVLDADGLWVTFSDPDLTKMLCRRAWPEKLIMTPHLGEFAHMAGAEIPKAAGNRISISRSLAKKCRGVILCKDARTIAAGYRDDRIFLNQYGTSGMAAAGSGDVLTGICGGFLAAGMEAFDAACAGCSAHARAGEAAAAELGDYSMKAGDIISHLPGLLK